MGNLFQPAGPATADQKPEPATTDDQQPEPATTDDQQPGLGDAAERRPEDPWRQDVERRAEEERLAERIREHLALRRAEERLKERTREYLTGGQRAPSPAARALSDAELRAYRAPACDDHRLLESGDVWIRRCPDGPWARGTGDEAAPPALA